MKTTSLAKGQAGSTLIEALVALLIFSFGVLGLLGLQAVSIKNGGDAKYRSDASYLANQIIAQMWVDRSNIDNYAHYQTGPVCAFTGSVSGNTNVTDWVTQVTSLLPGAASSKTQIQVSTPVAGTKQVKVTVCWQTLQETSAHNFVTTAQINQ
ncbi:type IV pilus modification protein PilV [Polaromonas sp. P1(28)-13]|nr:type IV pilus modification protein PilV [Polaromonas sp. P1(28)-13]